MILAWGVLKASQVTLSSYVWEPLTWDESEDRSHSQPCQPKGSGDHNSLITLNFHCGQRPYLKGNQLIKLIPQKGLKYSSSLWSSDLVHQNHLGVINTRIKGGGG